MEKEVIVKEKVWRIIYKEGKCSYQLSYYNVLDCSQEKIEHEDCLGLMAPEVIVYEDELQLSFSKVLVLDRDLDTFLENVKELRNFIKLVGDIRGEAQLELQSYKLLNNIN